MPAEFRFSTVPTSCTYLPQQTCQMNYRLVAEMDGETYAGMLDRGWRRFGYQFSRPICPACAKCRSLRVKVNEFTSSKAQRRALKRNADLRLVVQPASVTDEHIRVYKQYHAFMGVEKGWINEEMTAEVYATHFVSGIFPFAYEFLYFLGDTLVGVGLVDVTRRATSSVYFYHDPTLRARSLGVFSMMKELEYARTLGIPYHHLGYWVPECASMLYKSSYRPAELLLGYPLEGEEPLWVNPEDWRPILNTEEKGMIV